MAVPRFNLCTIWTKGEEDPLTGYSGEAVPRVFKCSLKRGGTTKLVNDRGEEFYPKSMYWVRASELEYGIYKEPSHGEMIAKGDHRNVTDPSQVNAEEIRSVTEHNHVKWGESDSFTIGTGG